MNRSIARLATAGTFTLLAALLSSCASDKLTEVTTAPKATAVTVAPSTAPPSVPATSPPPTTAAEPATTPAPETTAAPATTDAPVTTAAPTTAASTTTVIPVPARAIVAVDANGDAVVVQPDGTSTVLLDGTPPGGDPNDGSEGPSIGIDGVAVTSDGAHAFVGTCCEPSPGTLFARIGYAEPFAYGHAPAISPNGTKLAVVTFGAISVSAIDLTNPVSVDIPGTGNFTPTDTGYVEDVMWLDDTHLVVLATNLDSSAATLTKFEIAGEALVMDGSVVIAPAESFAGTGPGVIYTFNSGGTLLTAYGAVTPAPMTALDIVLPGAALSAYIQDGELRWVGTDRVLHVGDGIVAGEYIAVY